MLLADPGAIPGFGAAAASYVRLAHGVLGSVMFGWGVLLLAVVWGPLRRGEPSAWWMLAATLTAWFIPDTLMSILSGYGANAVLNAVIAIAFLVPLCMICPRFRRPRP